MNWGESMRPAMTPDHYATQPDVIMREKRLISSPAKMVKHAIMHNKQLRDLRSQNVRTKTIAVAAMG